MRKTLRPNTPVKLARRLLRPCTRIGNCRTLAVLCLIACWEFCSVLLSASVTQNGGPPASWTCASVASAQDPPAAVQARDQDAVQHPAVSSSTGKTQRADEVPEKATTYQDAIIAHMQYVTENSYDEEGDVETPMWLATIDLKTNRLPKSQQPRTPRWSTFATAPAGASLFWDQPTFAAACELSKRTGCKCYTDALELYAQSYFDACTDEETGVLWWGSEHYYDVIRDKPAGAEDQSFDLARTPAWQTLWSVDRSIVERQIRSMSEVRDLHPDSSIEPEWVLIESLSWLAEKDVANPQSLRDQAATIVQDRVAKRHPKTGLIETASLLSPAARTALTNGDASDRDQTSTAPLGHWINGLLNTDAQSEPSQLEKVADEIASSWLTYGYDAREGLYFDTVQTSTGRPLPANERGEHASVFPSSKVTPLGEHTNDKVTMQSPLPMAEACLTLFERTRKPVYRKATERWIKHVQGSLPLENDKVAFVEDYGRVIHFLARAGTVLDDDLSRRLAKQIADESMKLFYAPRLGMFRSHSGEDRCDSVDGIGYLLLALLSLEGPITTADSSFHF